jgi:hypothetical protein
MQQRTGPHRLGPQRRRHHGRDHGGERVPGPVPCRDAGGHRSWRPGPAAPHATGDGVVPAPPVTHGVAGAPARRLAARGHAARPDRHVPSRRARRSAGGVRRARDTGERAGGGRGDPRALRPGPSSRGFRDRRLACAPHGEGARGRLERTRGRGGRVAPRSGDRCRHAQPPVMAGRDVLRSRGRCEGPGSRDAAGRAERYVLRAPVVALRSDRPAARLVHHDGEPVRAGRAGRRRDAV